MIRSILIVVVPALTLAITAGCATSTLPGPAAPDAAADLLDRTWQWESTVTPAEKTAPLNPERYTLRLSGNGRLQARFDCNSGGGSYQIAAGSLSFGPLFSTRMACGPDSLDTVFMQDLGRADSFFVEGGQLYLRLKSDGAMRFRPAP